MPPSSRRKKPRVVLFAAAVALLATASWLMSMGDSSPPGSAKRQVEFPKSPRTSEWQRIESRRTYQAPSPTQAAEEEIIDQPLRDPLLYALASGPGETRVVIEANALRHSPLGELMIDCLRPQESQEFTRLQERLGIDPLADLDRVAMSGSAVVLTGNFGRLNWEEFEEASDSRAHGDAGTIFQPRSDAGAVAAVWRDELIIFAPEAGAAEEAIDRIEGRLQAEPALAEGESYGEVYGRISVEQLVALMGLEQDELAGRLRSAAKEVDLHVDASGDVAISADIRGPRGSELDDLGRSLAGAISLARLEARRQGEAELAELLDFAGVQRGEGQFTLELALPLELIRRHLQDACGGPVALGLEE